MYLENKHSVRFEGAVKHRLEDSGELRGPIDSEAIDENLVVGEGDGEFDEPSKGTRKRRSDRHATVPRLDEAGGYHRGRMPLRQCEGRSARIVRESPSPQQVERGRVRGEIGSPEPSDWEPMPYERR